MEGRAMLKTRAWRRYSFGRLRGSKDHWVLWIIFTWNFKFDSWTLRNVLRARAGPAVWTVKNELELLFFISLKFICSDITTLNDANLTWNQLRNFPTNFSVKFTTSFRSNNYVMKINCQIRRELREFSNELRKLFVKSFVIKRIVTGLSNWGVNRTRGSHEKGLKSLT